MFAPRRRQYADTSNKLMCTGRHRCGLPSHKSTHPWSGDAMTVPDPQAFPQLSEEDRAALSDYSRQPPGALRLRSSIVLACAEGLTNTEVAQRLQVSPATVAKWRDRYLRRGMAGLSDAPARADRAASPGRGRRRTSPPCSRRPRTAHRCLPPAPSRTPWACRSPRWPASGASRPPDCPSRRGRGTASAARGRAGRGRAGAGPGAHTAPVALRPGVHAAAGLDRQR